MACPCSCASSSAWLDQQTKTCELARGARLSRVCAGENPGSTALYFYLFDLVLVYAQTEKR